MRLAEALALVALGVSILSPPAIGQVSYFLDQSNEDVALPDGTNYLRVDVSEQGDDICFDVTILDPLLEIADSANFGLAAFGFNLADGATPIASASNIVGLPDNWSADVTGQRLDGFGVFQIVNDTNDGQDRVPDTLTFFVVGIVGDTPESYLALSSGNAGQGIQLFSARVA